MSDTLFSFHNLNMTDTEFWDQMQELDEIAEELPDFGGFSIKAKLASGKEVSVPFVRFRNTFPKKQS